MVIGTIHTTNQIIFTHSMYTLQGHEIYIVLTLQRVELEIVACFSPSILTTSLLLPQLSNLSTYQI